MLTGLLQIFAGWLRLGSLMRFVPRSVITGFVNALAILIFMAQVPEIALSSPTGLLSPCECTLRDTRARRSVAIRPRRDRRTGRARVRAQCGSATPALRLGGGSPGGARPKVLVGLAERAHGQIELIAGISPSLMAGRAQRNDSTASGRVVVDGHTCTAQRACSTPASGSPALTTKP